MKKTESRGKRFKKNDSNKKLKTVIVIIAILIIGVAITVAISQNNSTGQQPIETEESNTLTNNVDEEEFTNETDTPEVNESEMPKTMGGYNVIGQIVIDKIELKNYILHTTTDASLDLSVARYYGPKKANTAGNLCIIGHNYKGLFINLYKLNEGDRFYIIDSDNKEKVTYEIYKKYTINPSNLSCLDQNNDGKRVVTLITCNNGGVTRLILKAREVIE